MEYCSKCGQPEYHPPGSCPYDDEISQSYSRGIVFAGGRINEVTKKHDFAFTPRSTNDNLDL